GSRRRCNLFSWHRVAVCTAGACGGDAMRACLLGGSGAAALMIHAASAAQSGEILQVTVVPAQPLLERTLYGQAMNCEFRIANRGSDALELRVVNLAVRDQRGALIAT